MLVRRLLWVRSRPSLTDPLCNSSRVSLGAGLEIQKQKCGGALRDSNPGLSMFSVTVHAIQLKSSLSKDVIPKIVVTAKYANIIARPS